MDYQEKDGAKRALEMSKHLHMIVLNTLSEHYIII